MEVANMIEINTKLQPRQASFIEHYTNPESDSFGNGYRSAIKAGYSVMTARNITHLNPQWLSESIGNLQPIAPEQITQVLTSVIYNEKEPTYIKLKAVELMMKYHNMLKQHVENQTTSINLNLDLTSIATPP